MREDPYILGRKDPSIANGWLRCPDDVEGRNAIGLMGMSRCSDIACVSQVNIIEKACVRVKIDRFPLAGPGRVAVLSPLESPPIVSSDSLVKTIGFADVPIALSSPKA